MMRAALALAAVLVAVSTGLAAEEPRAPGGAASVESQPLPPEVKPLAPEAQPTARETQAPPSDPNNWAFEERTEDAAADTGSPTGEMLRLTLSLGAVLAVIVGGVYAFKRFAPRSSSMFASDHLKVLARTYIAPKQAIYLVRAPGCMLVLGATQERISVLTEITDQVQIERTLGAVEASSSKSATSAFSSLLAGGRTQDDAEGELAAAVRSVSKRFASLSDRLSGMERRADS